MIECKKYNPNMKDYSIRILKSRAKTKIEKRTEKRIEEDIQKALNQVSEADRILKWLETGSKVGLTQYTDSQLEQIKGEIEKFKHDFERDGIDINNQLEVLAYIYSKLQFKTLYKNPLVLTGRWGNMVEHNNIYGGLVEKYAPCAGIAMTSELLCKLYGIDAVCIGVNNGGVGHSISGIPLENGRYLIFDIANAIGMNCDGRYEGTFAGGDLRERTTYLYRKSIGTNDFGKKTTPNITDEKFKSIEPQIVSDSEIMEAFNTVERKINRHRIGDSKIEIMPRKILKIKTNTSEEPKHIKITPSNISDASRQITQYNPGKLSNLINAVKELFSRIVDKFKER